MADVLRQSTARAGSLSGFVTARDERIYQDFPAK
jgi:hypothetical protein